MNFLYLTSDKIGDGDDPEFGRLLLRKFLQELADSDARIDFIGCINSAVLLTSEGSQVLDSLRKLEAKGAQIGSCGTCLNHYGKELVIGERGNMQMAVALLTQADKVIRPT